MTTRTRIPLTLWLSLALAGTAVAPTTAQPDDGFFGETLDVRVVNVEVVVTDRDGVRVRGLPPDAFELLVDGEPRAIEFFTEVRGGVARAPEGGTSGIPDVQVPEVRPGRAVGTSYLVFIDELFSDQRDRDAVVESLRRQLAYLGPDDRMAVVAFDGRKVEMLSTWSQSAPRLDEVLREATRRPTRGRVIDAELRQLDRDDQRRRRNRFRGAGLYDLSVDELYYAQRLEDQLDRSVSAAASTLRGFGGPPGRKVMLLLSGGWPNHPAEYVVDDYHRPIVDGQIKGGAELYRSLADTANLLGYTLYPVDVPGFTGDNSYVDVAQRNPRLSALSVRENDEHFTLDYLARETGGRSFVNASRLDVMEEVHQDLAAYYWIGFTPQREANDTARDVEVRVRTNGLRVRHRSGFDDFSRSTEVTMAVESALLFGREIGGEGLSVTLGEAQRAGIGKVDVPLAVTIPLDMVTVVPYGPEYRGEVELRVAVQDDDGRLAPIPVIRLRLSLEEPPTPGATDRYETSLKLRRAEHDLVISVYDPASGRLLMASEHFEP